MTLFIAIRWQPAFICYCCAACSAFGGTFPPECTVIAIQTTVTCSLTELDIFAPHELRNTRFPAVIIARQLIFLEHLDKHRTCKESSRAAHFSTTLVSNTFKRLRTSQAPGAQKSTQMSMRNARYICLTAPRNVTVWHILVMPLLCQISRIQVYSGSLVA
jgi:hypothetical protein